MGEEALVYDEAECACIGFPVNQEVERDVGSQHGLFQCRRASLLASIGQQNDQMRSGRRATLEPLRRPNFVACYV